MQTHFSQKNFLNRSSFNLDKKQISTHHFKSATKKIYQGLKAHSSQNLKQSSECSTMDVQAAQDFYLQQQTYQTQNHAELYRKSVEWMAKNQKKLKIKIQTFYLGISYLLKFFTQNGKIFQQNFQKISAVLLLIASKMNEIYSIQLQDIVLKCGLSTSKQELISIESQILKIFKFQTVVFDNCYSIIKNSVFCNEKKQRTKNAQKILFMSIFEYEAFQFGEEYLAYAIIYLLQPQLLNLVVIDIQKTKQIASKVYQKYLQKKSERQIDKNL